MPSLCCFWHPSPDFRERAPGEVCPECQRQYDLPLQHPPKQIARFTIQEAISRGFYSAVYRASQESLGRTVVLKVVPVAIYEYFKKDWVAECREHAAIAQGTPFVAGITEQFDDTVDIAGLSVPCHVAVLENIPGPTLQQALQSPAQYKLTPRLAAQVGADLFEILHLFIERGRFHNDLHGGNIIIQPLGSAMSRSGAIDANVRAVAIDLGSVLDADRSGGHNGRVIGDQHQVARHLSMLARAVQNRPRSDVDFRIAGALRGLAEHLTPASEAQRLMTVDDALQAIRSAMSAVDEPWRQPLSLHRFGDAYNAQALESWHVPELWFDPNNTWFTKTTGRGPQVITGMRGCGKTMLLRALHFHARAADASKNRDARSALAHLDKDSFLGVFASCQKLLDPQRHSGGPASLPFERLYIAYLRDAIQVLRHLRSLDSGSLLATLDVLLRDALKPLDLDFASLTPGEHEFEQFLLGLQLDLADGTARCRLRMAPAEAFGHLASVIRASAVALAQKYVLFLLDDVSTRYLQPEMVRDVISKLLFQHPICAFRISTEAQALQRVLLSPGGSAPADPNRDYEAFDLGNEVYAILQQNSTQQNMEFISEILRRRGRQFQDELYRREPLQLLGETTLEQIASEIATSSPSSPVRKQVYRGLRAIQAVCVGDLGDVVKLYEKILRRANVSERTVPAEKQCECFLEHSGTLIHFLNRVDGHAKGLALAFAQASAELLQRSMKNGDVAHRRLRQYAKLYVRVDAGSDFEDVAIKLLALLDKGVFVYDGGVQRTKTRDYDPVLQFKLSYRKMLGLSSYIGLADRDRFELSGQTLKRWLEKPEEAKDILLKSQAKNLEPTNGELQNTATNEAEAGAIVGQDLLTVGQPVSPLNQMDRESRVEAKQLELLGTIEAPKKRQVNYAPSIDASVVPISLESLGDREVDTVILALGFEERTKESAERLLKTVRPRRVLLVKYHDPQGEEIAHLLARLSLATKVISSWETLGAHIQSAKGDVVVDCSGLSKPFLFLSVRDALRFRKRAIIVHTLAQEYYPRNEDLEARGITASSQANEIFERLQDVFMGEAGPYQLLQVHDQPAEPERWLAVMASASPKNDRLLHLLLARTYEAARIFVPPATSARRRVARAAAELAASAADSNVGLIEVDSNDLEGALRATEEIYNNLYFGSGANVEIGLTGSKMHAVAFGALAAAARVSSAWYVSPKSFDMQRFTIGTGETRCFELTVSI